MSNRPFVGARIEESITRLRGRLLRRYGWRETIIPFTGYGSEQNIRLLGRAVLLPPGKSHHDWLDQDQFLSRRGWRNFLPLPIPGARVRISLGHQSIDVKADRGGYVDVRLINSSLAPGWHEVAMHVGGSPPIPTPIQIISDSQEFGIISDIDDTIISTLLPRPLIAAWNTFVSTEQARQAVPGMASLYRGLLDSHAGAPVIYVSTGAWNTYPFLKRFMERNGYPAGPMLLTDWGPTNSGWFRSGFDHKQRAFRELARDFPTIQWLTVGDDGQHDPELYAEFAELQPGHVRGIAIRQLTPAEHVLAHGTTSVMHDAHQVEWKPLPVAEVRAPDGYLLKAAIAETILPDESS